MEVQPYPGANPLYRHGYLRVAANHRHLTHADGTPFHVLVIPLFGIASFWEFLSPWNR